MSRDVGRPSQAVRILMSGVLVVLQATGARIDWGIDKNTLPNRSRPRAAGFIPAVSGLPVNTGLIKPNRCPCTNRLLARLNKTDTDIGFRVVSLPPCCALARRPDSLIKDVNPPQ